MTGPLDDTDTRNAALAALAAEHAAIWCHGLATAYLTGADAAALTDAAQVHRDRRDALIALCEADGVTPVTAAAGYATPEPVTDAASAATMLAAAETDCVGGWRALLERTDDPGLRRAGVDAVVGSTAAGTRWRVLAGITPVVPTFPGA